MTIGFRWITGTDTPREAITTPQENKLMAKDKYNNKLKTHTHTHTKRGYKTVNMIKVSKGAKIRNRHNQVPHPTQDTNGKVTDSQ